MTFMKMPYSWMILSRLTFQENRDAQHQRQVQNQDFNPTIQNKTQVHNIFQKKNLYIKGLKNIRSVSEEALLSKMLHQPQTVQDQEGMFPKHVPFHHIRKTSQNGHCQKLAEQQLKSLRLIEIKHMIPDQLSEHNIILRTELDSNVTSDQVIEDKLRNWAHLRIRCKEELVLRFIIQSGEDEI